MPTSSLVYNLGQHRVLISKVKVLSLRYFLAKSDLHTFKHPYFQLKQENMVLTQQFGVNIDEFFNMLQTTPIDFSALLAQTVVEFH